MGSYNKTILGQNISSHRRAAGLTLNKFANLNKISKTTLRNIEAGANSASSEKITSILEFLGMQVESAAKDILPVPSDFRKTLQIKHSDNSEYKKLLNDTPSIPYALEFQLLPSGLLNTPQTIKSIKEYFDSLGWIWSAHLISDAIRENKDELKIITRKKDNDKRAYEYFVV